MERATRRSGEMVVRPRPATYWSDPANDKGSAVQERYWNPTVLVRGPIAVVWSPYEFKIDGQTSLCGIDVFDFVKVEGAWRVANAMWTVEADAREILRSTDGAAIHPRGPSEALRRMRFAGSPLPAHWWGSAVETVDDVNRVRRRHKRRENNPGDPTQRARPHECHVVCH